MPKMKVLETGQAPEEVVLMSWSPKMDLLAVGTLQGNIQLHRLSWQRVWQVSLTLHGDAVLPELMAWHPEGLFLIASSGPMSFVIDVECGKVVHSHELPIPISTMKWCMSEYTHAVSDVLSTQSKQNSDYLRSDLKIQRLESNLSILLLGTDNGFVYIYTGGFLLGLCLQAGEEGSTSRVLQMDVSPSLETFQFLTDEDGGQEDMILSFSHFKNEYLPEIAPVIGPLGLKYILFLKNWAMIQGEISGLNEHWARLVDLHNNYLTLGGTRDMEAARVDYLELLLTGITCVEMELFLGDGGREKEAKKCTNAINTTNASITEHVRTIKCSIVNLLTELNEIGGFLQQLSGYEEANKLMVELRKCCNYLFLAILQIQGLVHNYVEIYLHFMHMIMNTIHSYNAQEAPDYIEEDADTDKVLEFLETNMDKDIFQFLIKNVTLGSPDVNEDGTKCPPKKRACPFGELNFPEKNALGVLKEDCSKRDFYCFPELLYDLVKKYHKGPDKHSMLMDFTESEVSDFLCNLVPTMHKLTKGLLNIPALCAVSFEADFYQLTRLSKSQYLETTTAVNPEAEKDTENDDMDMDNDSPPLGKQFQMAMDPQTNKTTISCLWSSRKVLFLEVDFHDTKKMIVKSLMLNFSRNIIASKLFSENYITVVSYEPPKQPLEAVRTTICQVQYRNLIGKAVSVDLIQLKSMKCGWKSSLPSSVLVDIPLDISKPCVPANISHVDFALPIEGFTPFQLQVSGPRKVGALLADNRKTVLLIEMETDLSETSYDDTADASDSEDSN